MKRIALLAALVVAALSVAAATATASPVPGAVVTHNTDGTVTIVMTQEGYGPNGIGGWSCKAGDYPGTQSFPSYTVGSFTVEAANGPGSFTAQMFGPGDVNPFGGFRPADEYGVDIYNGADSNAWITLTLVCDPPVPVTGTWNLTAPSSTSYQAVVQQPINPDGSSSWPAKKGVIPVQFQLLANTNTLFESIGSDTSTSDDYSALSFTPNSGAHVRDILNLAANYTFTLGDCHGGALRWSISTPLGHVFVYYGATPNFTNCTTANQSGVNLLSLGDLRVDTSQIAGGNFYDTWAHALALVGGQPASGISLVLDGGWVANGDQIVTLSSATVNGNTWTAPAVTGFAPTCTLPTAKIVVQRTGDALPIVTDEVLSVASADTTGFFRQVDCKYIYNLATASLGVGTYNVWVSINGNLTSPGIFTLR